MFLPRSHANHAMQCNAGRVCFQTRGWCSRHALYPLGLRISRRVAVVECEEEKVEVEGEGEEEGEREKEEERERVGEGEGEAKGKEKGKGEEEEVTEKGKEKG